RGALFRRRPSETDRPPPGVEGGTLRDQRAQPRDPRFFFRSLGDAFLPAAAILSSESRKSVASGAASDLSDASTAGSSVRGPSSRRRSARLTSALPVCFQRLDQ